MQEFNRYIFEAIPWLKNPFNVFLIMFFIPIYVGALFDKPIKRWAKKYLGD